MGKDICFFHWDKICTAGDLENKLLAEIGLMRNEKKQVVKLKKNSNVSGL